MAACNVTMAVFHLRGFYETDKTLKAASSIERINEGFIDVVGKHVRLTKGALHSFDCGVAVALWNAHIPIVGHPRTACSAVYEIV